MGMTRWAAGLGQRKAWTAAAAWTLLMTVVVVTYALLPGVASAAPKTLNGFVGGDISLRTGGFVPGAWDVAVYDAGTPAVDDDKMFVVEGFSGHSDVQRLDRHGNFELMWGQNVIRPAFAGDTGTGFEVCTAVVSGAAGCQPGDTTGVQGGALNISTGVAVDQTTGHVYVMDAGNRRVQEFDLAGQFVRAWGWGVDTGASEFQVCTTSCQAGLVNPSDPTENDNPGQFSNIASGTMSSIAVSPVAPHDVFVTDPGNRRVLQFTSAGSFIRAWGFDVSPGAPSQFETCESTPPGCQAGGTPGVADGQFAPDFPRHIAIDADGVVYASDSGTDHRVVVFDSDPPPTPATAVDVAALSSSVALGDGETTGLEIDSDTGNLLVVRDSSTGKTITNVREIADPGSELSLGLPDPVLVDDHVFADAADNAAGIPSKSLGFDPANGNIYLVAGLFAPPSGSLVGCPAGTSGFCSGLMALATSTGPLSASLDPPSDVGADSVSLQGSVDPAGGVARYRFQVSADGESWTDVSDPRYVAGSGSQDVSVVTASLQPATLYRTRLLVSKLTDIDTLDTAVSSETVFLTDATAPAVTTLGSTKRTDISVRLRGLVDPQGSATSYRFEYGPAGGSFDHHVPIPNAEAGSGNAPELRTQDVMGLQPDTAYHYRVVATNFVGTTTGDAVMFRTKPSAPLPEPPPERGYELVSPTEKISGVGVGIWYQGPATAGLAGVAAHDGERFAVQSTFGAVLSDGVFSFANDGVLAERAPDGWVGEPTASRRAYGNQTLVFMRILAATPDLSMIAYGNAGLKLFPEQENWIKEDVGLVLYLRDWEKGTWELFGPTDSSQRGDFQQPTIADDGKSMVAFSDTRGLLGPSDPTIGLAPGVVNVFMDEVPDGASDIFPGTGTRSIVNACGPGTEIPVRIDLGGGAFKQGAQDCSGPLISEGGASLGQDTDRVISRDGSRVFFMSPTSGGLSCSGIGTSTACPPQLYVRQRMDADTVVTRWISRTEVTQANGASADQDASLLDKVEFEGASKDGDKVFFSTASPLTADDRNGQGQAPPPGGVVDGPANSDSWDLYMYDMPDAPGADPADGQLTRVSAGPTGDGDCNSVRGAESENVGALRLASDDGSRLYFTCSGPLEAVPLPDDGTITSPGGNPSDLSMANLYSYDATKPAPQRWRFVARLPRSTPLGGCATESVRPGNPIAGANEQSADLLLAPVNCMRGTRDGSFVTFFTDGRLTDDDPDASSGDLYAYDATQDELMRVTAPQGGVGGSYPCLVNPSGPRCYGDDGIGHPTGLLALPKLGVAEPSDGRRTVFFESRSRLVPADKDSAYDVYQWQDGELSLISTGNSDTDGAFYAGSDRTGKNVYIATRDRLTWQDHDAVLDVYTARIDGGIPQPPPTDEACDPKADQCQGPGQAPGRSQTDSDVPTGGNPPTPARVALALRNPSAKARRRAARTGRLKVRVSSTGPTKIALYARAKLGRKTVKAGPAITRTFTKAASTTVTIRLTKAVRQRLRRGRQVSIAITARAARARSATTSLTLARNP